MTTQTLTEFLQAEGVNINTNPVLKATVRVHAERKATVDLLDKLIHEATKLRTAIDTEDVHTFAYAARNHAFHAGYSNTITAMSAEITANLASLNARIEGMF